MRLEQYLYQRKEPQINFSRRSDVPTSIVSRVCAGQDTSGKRWAQISAATGGKVRCEHHFPVRKRAA